MLVLQAMRSFSVGAWVPSFGNSMVQHARIKLGSLLPQQWCVFATRPCWSIQWCVNQPSYPPSPGNFFWALELRILLANDLAFFGDEGSFQDRLDRAYEHFQNFAKERKIPNSQPRFRERHVAGLIKFSESVVCCPLFV